MILRLILRRAFLPHSLDTPRTKDDLKEILCTNAYVEDLLRKEQIEAGVQRVAHENLFFETLAAKRERERNYMLTSSDWRVLPDVETPNKDMWVRWRHEMRSLPAFNDTYEVNLALYKAFAKLKCQSILKYSSNYIQMV